MLQYINRKIEESPFNQLEMSEMLDVSRMTLYNYRKGKTDIPSDKMKQLINLLSLDLNELYKK